MANEGLTLVRDRWYTALTADVTSAATTLPVATNTVGGNVLPTPCIIMCGFEQMYATASTATTITVTRGFNSTAAAHAKGATVGIARVAAHHNDMVTGLLALGAGTIAGKNRVINGSMRIAQRGVFAVASDNTYQAADRWRTITNITAGSVPSVQVIGGSYALVSGGGTGKMGVLHVIENLDMFDLTSQSISVRAAVTSTMAGQTDVRCAVLYQVGTADATSADPVTTWGAAGAGVTTWNGWVTINTPATLLSGNGTATVNLTSLAVPSNAANLAVMIWNDATGPVNGTALYINDVQLEKGTTCTEFERLPLAVELLNCQRYFCKTFPLATTPAQNTGSVLGALTYRAAVAGATAQGVRWQFPSRMRTAPTITTYNPSAANSNWRNATDNADSGASSTAALGENGVFIGNAQAAGDAAGEILHVHATAAAEL
jgi:hypothetical protein